MAWVAPQEGNAMFMAAALLGTTLTGITLRLFVNNFTPDETTTYGDFTECTDALYAPYVIPSWTVITPMVGSALQSPPAVFNFNGVPTVTVYGYYVSCSNGGGRVLFANTFTSPLVFAGIGPASITLQVQVGVD